MSQTAVTSTHTFEKLLDYANRADPYPFYAELRRQPVQRLDDGTYVVTGYQEILKAVHDPRISSDPRNLTGPAAGHGHGADTPDRAAEPGLSSAFVMLDPPEHDRLRRLTMRHFGPPHKPGYVDSLRADLTRIVNGLIDGFDGRPEVDIVTDFAYPLPVIMICEVLGVPPEDEHLFHAWSETIIAPPEATSPEDAADKQRKSGEATAQMARYLGDVADARRGEPRGDLLSGLVNDDGPEGRMSRVELLNTAIMLLIGGHETTVNMISNGVLTLLRNPEVIARLQREPEMIGRVFEELLRYEPPAQITPTRVALTDVVIGGTTIPQGSPIWIMWAAANRDPEHFVDPDRFDPDRATIDHLSFGSGVHSCFGAPLARLETQIALGELFRRLVNPRLVIDPPPYRRNAFLRGPSSLQIAFDGVERADREP